VPTTGTAAHIKSARHSQKRDSQPTMVVLCVRVCRWCARGASEEEGRGGGGERGRNVGGMERKEGGRCCACEFTAGAHGRLPARPCKYAPIGARLQLHVGAPPGTDHGPSHPSPAGRTGPADSEDVPSQNRYNRLPASDIRPSAGPGPASALSIMFSPAGR
jgi:hypothetical protein